MGHIAQHDPSSQATALRYCRRTGVALAVAQAVVCAAMGSALLMAPVAHAQPAESARSYDIPAGSLTSVLNRFGREAGIMLSFSTEMTNGLQSAGLSGSYAVHAALNALLAGTQLQAIRQGDGGYLVQRVPDSASGALPPAGAATLAPITVTARAERSATTEGAGSYAAQAATIGKMTQSLREIPQSVTVITRQRIEDQNLSDLDRVLAQTPGIVVSAWDAQTSSITSRGFDVTDVQFDGITSTLLTGNASPATSPDTALFDRVEVLRGSAGLLKGTGNPSATVNLVRKRPTHEFQASTNLSVGSWNNRRAELDVSGPLTTDGRVRGRLVAVQENAESYIDVVKHRKSLIYGIAEMDLTPNTLLTLGVRTQEWKGVPWGWGTPASSSGQFLGLSRSTYLGQRWNSRTATESEAFAQLEHRLDNGWKIEGAINWSRTWGKSKQVLGIGGASGVGAGYAQGVDLSNPLVSLRANVYDGGSTQLGTDWHASGPFELFGRKHELVIGVDARKYKFRSYDEALSQDLYSSSYSYVGNPYAWNANLVPELSVQPATGYSTTDITQSGLYATTRFSLRDDLKLILGGRLSRWETSSASYALPSGNRKSKSGYEVNDELTPFAGAVWSLTPTWNAYASYADIFTPQNAIDSNGNLVKPIVGASYEAGVKGELADGALNASLAVFRIKQKNRAVSDLSGPSPCPVSGNTYCSVASGTVLSEGFEAEISGQVAKNLELFAGYTYNTTKYLEDNDNAGKIFNTYTPKHILRLWANYRLPGDWSRLSLGGGLSVMSESYAESGTVRLTQGGYSLVNLAASYRINDRLSLALNVDNVFDKIYYSRIGSKVNGNIYGEPRKFTLTLRAKF